MPTLAPEKKSIRLPFFKRLPDRKPPLRQPLELRDIEIIKAVHENRFLTFSIVRHLFPPLPATPKKRIGLAAEIPTQVTPATTTQDPPKHSGTRLYKRLQALFHHSYLRRIPPLVYGGEFIYALDTKGAETLRGIGIPLKESIDWYEKNRALSTMFLDHTLMVARFRAALIVALKDHPTLSLATFERENERLKITWKHDGKGRKISVKPDALILLKDHQKNGYLGYLLEADRSTMPLNRMVDKYTRYSLMFEDEAHLDALKIDYLRVLTVCKSTERTQSLHGLPFRKDLPRPDNSPVHKTYYLPEDDLPLFYFTHEQNYLTHPRNILAAIWRRADASWLREDGKEDTRGITRDPLPLIVKNEHS